MRFTAERGNLYLQFAFLLNIVRLFFNKLFNIEAKMIPFTSMLNNGEKKIIYNVQ